MSIDLHLYEKHYFDKHYLLEQIYEANYHSKFITIIEQGLKKEIEKGNFYQIEDELRYKLIDKIWDYRLNITDKYIYEALDELIDDLKRTTGLYLMVV